MRVEGKLSHLKGVKWHEWAVRFVFGGACTVAAGLIAKHWGPVVGGLFLAFPAIFPAGASLIEQHEIEHKKRIGVDGTARGRAAASVDAAGASLACFGLVGFALVVWKGLPGHNAVCVIAGATAVWMAVSVALWVVRKSRWMHRRKKG
ncbi:MAG TPA: hypothetical protein VGU46_10250 [Acidobacteriaceae bacterium]|nr:hypothetical protein [Acidobacteriaceae bacterium]